MLCLLACEAFGGSFDEAKYSALALETAHNHSLIHDDVLDQAPMRRGKETVYKKWNANQAILSGDAALLMAFDYALRTHRPVEVVSLLKKSLLEICEGQQLDLDFESRELVSADEYLEMIRLKTAVLLATSLQIGAVVANADEEDQKNIYDFGLGIGMAFQLQDDILDCYSDVAVFGKVTGGDILENKKTMMYLKALELASPSQRERLLALYSGELSINPQRKIDEVITIYDELHVKEAVEIMVEGYFSKAYARLNDIKLPDERKGVFKQYADLLVGRDK